MKKKIYFFLSIIILLLGCSKDDFFSISTSRSVINVPKHIDEFGKSVAKEIRQTVNNLNKNGVNFADADYSDAFRQRFYSEWFKASQTETKNAALISDVHVNPIRFAERSENLTDMQLKFVKRIIDECDYSISLRNFNKTIVKLNKEINTEVPEIEQERLLYVTTILYYVINEVHRLEKQGQMLITPKTMLDATMMKTRTETGGGGVWGKCREVYEIITGYVVGMVISTGEVVTSISTTVVGGIFMFAITLCMPGDTPQYKDYCAEKFAECQAAGGPWTYPNSGGYGYSMCNRCHEYCISTRGIWSCPRPV